MEKGRGLVGTKIGNYEVVEYLGYGAMARVYKGYHTNLDRFAAIKILHSQFAADSEFVELFKREAKNLANLFHPNIVQVYDFDLYNEIPYIVMEYIEGPTLKDVIDKTHQRSTRLSLMQTVRIIQSIGRALSYAHKMNIIHRDVKPSNILLENTGRVVLSDFGLARLMSGNQLTLTGTVKGTPAYMSPEQSMGHAGRHISDIYSLGVIFYELVTGKLPHTADSPLAILMKHVNEPIVPPKSLVPETPEAVQKIILKATHKKEEVRYQTADEMLKDLALYESKTTTGMLPSASLSLETAEALKETDHLKLPETSKGARLSLHFVDTGQILEVGYSGEYTMGRRYKNQAVVPDIDLTPFNAYEWGISRLHAKLQVDQNSVKIIDLGSSNGTYLAGKRIPVNKPVELKHSNILSLGKLKLQVLIYQ